MRYVFVLLALVALAISSPGAEPPRKPLRPDPVLVLQLELQESQQSKPVVKSCYCSENCICGCQTGEPCDCLVLPSGLTPGQVVQMKQDVEVLRQRHGWSMPSPSRYRAVTTYSRSRSGGGG